MEGKKKLTRSKAVEQARGCVATKMGLADIADNKPGLGWRWRNQTW